ncbi:MAG TPA: ferrochelatase [Phycisphaerae bacterium]|nr:ferrochelatase [Phycisphaerae bacterium]
MDRKRPFDAVLIIAFGGPEAPEHVRPFLENVVRGKPVPRERLEQVARNYERFGGISPLPAVTRSQATGLRERLGATGVDLPVFVGMRNWHPFLADTLADMARQGVRRAIGFIAAAHHSYPSCGEYKKNVREACQALRRQGLPEIGITYVDSWYVHPDFIRAYADHVREAINRLEPPLRERARIVFSAHSIPTVMAGQCCYRQHLEITARGVLECIGRRDWALVYQSRSGRPQDPWLEPDINDYLRSQRACGLEAAVVVPIGFIIDHIEVLYDLDVRAAEVCREIGLPMARARTLNDDPLFLDMMADVVRRTWERGRECIPLPITESHFNRHAHLTEKM